MHVTYNHLAFDLLDSNLLVSTGCSSSCFFVPLSAVSLGGDRVRRVSYRRSQTPMSTHSLHVLERTSHSNSCRFVSQELGADRLLIVVFQQGLNGLQRTASLASAVFSVLGVATGVHHVWQHRAKVNADIDEAVRHMPSTCFSLASDQLPPSSFFDR